MLSIQATALDPQDYSPRYDLPDSGDELIMLFIGSSRWKGDGFARLPASVHKAKILLQERVERSGRAFFDVSAAVQWVVEDAADYLLDREVGFGLWDEVWLGRSWLNTAATTFVWHEASGDPTILQLLVFRRPAAAGPGGVSVGQHHEVLLRLVGAKPILDWIDRGAPLIVR